MRIKRVHTCKNCAFCKFVSTGKYMCHFGGDSMIVFSGNTCEEFKYNEKILKQWSTSPTT